MTSSPHARQALFAFALAAPLLAFAAPGPLATARAKLEEGKLDEVLFALDGKHFEGAEKLEAARVLADAGRASLEKGDALFALQFAQMALRDDPKNAEALEVGARASFKAEQFTPAEKYADRWIDAEPKAVAPRLLRAEIALSEGDWARVLDITQPLENEQLRAVEQEEWTRLREKARKELDALTGGRTAVRSLDQRLAKAVEQAKALDREPSFDGPSRPEVIIYSTSWCAYCKGARSYFELRHVPYEWKDIEKDLDARAELNQLAARTHVYTGGGPAIDVNGRLVTHFNSVEIDSLLQTKP